MPRKSVCPENVSINTVITHKGTVGDYLVVGDLHGRVQELARIDLYAQQNGIEHIFQVGDFGIYWPGSQCPIAKYFDKRQFKAKRKGISVPTWHVIPGNHDVWPRLFPTDPTTGFESKIHNPYLGLYFYNRNVEIEIELFRCKVKCLTFGGAISSDGHHRIEDKTWWRKEAPSREEYDILYAQLFTNDYDLIFSHDSPILMDRIKTLNSLHFPNRWSDEVNRELNEIRRDIVKEKVMKSTWYHGHHHLVYSSVENGPLVIGCGLNGDFVRASFVNTNIEAFNVYRQRIEKRKGLNVS